MKKILLVLLCALCVGQSEDLNERGWDPRVDYNELFLRSIENKIPWDDRNLELTKEDLVVLPPGDIEDSQNIPFFFRVILRKQYPQIRDSGPGQYPRSAAEVFELFWGGIMENGVVEAERKFGGTVNVNQEIEITTGRNSAESAIAINPVFPNRVISGVNGPTGQEMYFSSDGGINWTRSTSNLGGSCCDPTVGWSPDGLSAYMVQLGTCSSLCNIEFFKSIDFGQTWTDKRTLNNAGNNGTNDKEFLHVDLSPTSPHLGNIYVHWHSFNTITFGRSTDGGTTWDSPISFGGTQGIGGDIATDRSGTVFHVWPRTSGGTIRMNRSFDGGASFDTIQQIADTNASFDYPIPCFDNRFAFIYTSVAVDLSAGPFSDRVYVCWNDTNGPESSNPVNNHSKIVLAHSADGGDSWTEVSPHSLADIDTVDRFNPWMDVDTDGRVHVVYYSTENDANRLKPDMYHTTSDDGGVTWANPIRITATSSNYIGDNFQWGDYNGMAVVNGEIRPIWTDNRTAVRAWTAEMNIAGGSGDFSLSTIDPNRTICGIGIAQPIDIEVGTIDGFNDPIDFAFNPTLPDGVTAQFSQNPFTPPGTLSVSLEHDGSENDGILSLTLEGNSGALTHDTNFSLDILNISPEILSSYWTGTNPNQLRYDFDADEIITTLDIISYQGCNLP